MRDAEATPEQQAYLARITTEAADWYIRCTKEGILRYILTVSRGKKKSTANGLPALFEHERERATSKV